MEDILQVLEGDEVPNLATLYFGNIRPFQMSDALEALAWKPAAEHSGSRAMITCGSLHKEGKSRRISTSSMYLCITHLQVSGPDADPCHCVIGMVVNMSRRDQQKDAEDCPTGSMHADGHILCRRIRICIATDRTILNGSDSFLRIKNCSEMSNIQVLSLDL